MFRLIKNAFQFMAALFAGALFVVLFTVPSLAQSPDEIRFTATTEIAVPDHLLQPGTYYLRRLNSANPSIYEILDSNREYIGVEQVIPARRAERGDSEIDISNPDSAGVCLLKTWFGPGDTDGYRFIYSKNNLRKLDQLAEAQAKATGSLPGQP